MIDEDKIIEKLKTTNHLKLNISNIPVAEMITEMQNISNFSKFDTESAHKISNMNTTLPDNDWSVAYLKNLNGEYNRHDYWSPEEYNYIPNKNNTKIIKYKEKIYQTRWDDDIDEADIWEYDLSNFQLSAGNLTQFHNKMKITELGKKCPITVKWVHDTFGYSLRFGFSKLKRETGRVFKHSHFAFHGGKIALPYLYQVIHVPLITNDKSRFIVFDKFDNSRYQDSKHYKINEAWVFNSYKYHASINSGDSDRYHLLCFIWIPKNKKFLNLLNEALQINDY